MADETITLRSKQPHAPLPTPPAAKAVEEAQIPDPNDPMERARRRAAELREHASFDVGGDKFAFDPSIVPPGWSYEWKRQTVMGAPDPSYQVSLAQRGWEAVPASRHPEMMPLGYEGATIDRDGQRLMERPAVITADARELERREARDLVRGKEAQVTGAPAGDNSPFDPLSNGKDGKGRPLGIKKSYTSEVLEIPKS
jgi:hypothetical protein